MSKINKSKKIAAAVIEAPAVEVQAVEVTAAPEAAPMTELEAFMAQAKAAQAVRAQAEAPKKAKAEKVAKATELLKVTLPVGSYINRTGEANKWLYYPQDHNGKCNYFFKVSALHTWGTDELGLYWVVLAAHTVEGLKAKGFQVYATPYTMPAPQGEASDAA